MNIPLDQSEDAVKRDRWGRYLIVPAAGGKAVAHTRATTVAETLDDRYNLELWKMRQVAIGLAANRDLLDLAATATNDKAALNKICADASDRAGARSAANLGTAIHASLERVNRGEAVDALPEQHRGFAHEYTAALAAAGFAVAGDVERIHVLSTYTIAGTADLHVTRGGRRYIADIKTGGGIDFGARGFAVQLAIYAAATSLYDPVTERHEPMPEVDQERALIIHVPAAGGPVALHWLDIAAGREALEYAVWTRAWRKRKDLLADVDGPVAVSAPQPETAAVHPDEVLARRRLWLRGRVEALDDAGRRTLAAHWPADLPTLRQERLSREELDAIVVLLNIAEAKVEAPFAPPDPTITRERPPIGVPDTRAPWVSPEEGPALTVTDIAPLRAALAALSVDAQQRVVEWLKEGSRAGRSFATSGGNITARRFDIARAMIRLAEDEDLARTLIGIALGVELAPTMTTGMALGSLTRSEAVLLADLAQQIAEGTHTLRFDAAGVASVA